MARLGLGETAGSQEPGAFDVKDRAWYVGLPCRVCGERVTGKKDGLYVQPVDRRGRSLEPWAEHYACKEKR
jgi:hypothetical protein